MIRQPGAAEKDVLACRGVRRALEKRSEPFAAVDVASLGVRTQLARVHILDHTLTQRGDSFGCHKATPVLSEVEDTSILKTGRFPRYL
jgi:hypothetical protein